MALPRPSVVYVAPSQAAGFVRTNELPQILRIPATETVFISTNISGPQGPQGPQGDRGIPGEDAGWVRLVANYDPANPPVLLETIPEGDVYQYTYANGTLYRLVSSSNDAFYTTFSSSTVSGLVTERAAVL